MEFGWRKADLQFHIQSLKFRTKLACSQVNSLEHASFMLSFSERMEFEEHCRHLLYAYDIEDCVNEYGELRNGFVLRKYQAYIVRKIEKVGAIRNKDRINNQVKKTTRIYRDNVLRTKRDLKPPMYI